MRDRKTCCQILADTLKWPSASGRPLYFRGDEETAQIVFGRIRNELLFGNAPLIPLSLRGEDFVDYFITAVRAGTAQNLYEKLCQCSLLLISGAEFFGRADLVCRTLVKILKERTDTERPSILCGQLHLHQLPGYLEAANLLQLPVCSFDPRLGGIQNFNKKQKNMEDLQ